MIAVQNGHTQTVKRLLQEGANINHQSKVRTMLYDHLQTTSTLMSCVSVIDAHTRLC